MRKAMMIVAATAGLTVAALAASTSAEARFGAATVADAVAGSLAEPAQYYYGYRRRYYAPRYYAPYYAPRYYAPRYYAPYYAPRYYRPRYYY